MIIAVILLFILLKIEDRIERYINVALIWTLICFGITEFLSALHAVSSAGLRICWVMVDAILIVCNIVKYRKCNWKQEFNLPKKNPISGKVFLWGAFSIGMLCLALKTIPYNWDSMTYHLPRVVYWLQNGTVGHFATHNERQVASPVLGAFVNLHVYAMANSADSLMNLLQCCSYLFNGVLTYHIARKINCTEKYCIMAAVLFYSMPIAFAEALTTQVDNFSALWMLSFVYLLLEFLKPGAKIVFSRQTMFRVIGLSLCIAFGYLAKPSVGFGMVFFALWLLITVIIRRDRIVTLVAYIAIAAGVLAMVLSPEFARNISTYRALSSPGTGQRQLIGTLHERYILTNCVKNLTFNMPTIWIYDSSDMIRKSVMRLSEALNIDIDDPMISEDGREFSVHAPQNYGHDTALNPLIVWLLLAGTFCLILKNRKRGLSEMRNQYFIVSGFSFCFFCAVLRWEPFVSRYMLSYLALLCPAVSGQLELFFEGEGERNRSREIGLIAVLYFLCITEMMGLVYCHVEISSNQTEDRGYFTNRLEIAENYKEIAAWVNDKTPENIGLLTSGDSYEYPLLVMLNDYERIEHVNVMNATGIYENQDFIPDVIIAIDYYLPPGEFICHNNTYEITEVITEGTCLLSRVY